MKTFNLGRLVSIGARGGASIADQGAAAAVSFLASVFIGRHIGAEALGIYAITNVFVTLIRAFQNSIVLEPMSVYGSRRRVEEKAAYFGFLIGFETIWVGFLAILLVLGSTVAWVLGRIEAPVLYALYAGGVFSFLICFQHFLRRQFYIELRQYLAMIQSLAFLLLVAAGFAGMWWLDGWTVVDVYILLCTCSVIVCVVQGGRFWRSVGVPDRAQRRQYTGEHWSYGKWLLLTVPLGIVTYQGYFFIVGSLVSTEAAGLLKAVETLIGPFLQVSIGLSLMLTPMASRNIDRMSVAAQQVYALQISVALVGLAVIYSAFVYFGGEYALRALFGDEVEGAFPLIKIMAFVPVFSATHVPAGIVLSALRRSKLRFISQMMSVAGTAFVGVPLVIAYGAIGAAFGFVLTGVLFTIGQWSCLFWLWRRQARLQPV